MAWPIGFTLELDIGHEPEVEVIMLFTHHDAKTKYLDLNVCAYQRYCLLPRNRIIGASKAHCKSVIWKKTELKFPLAIIGREIEKNRLKFPKPSPGLHSVERI